MPKRMEYVCLKCERSFFTLIYEPEEPIPPGTRRVKPRCPVCNKTVNVFPKENIRP